MVIFFSFHAETAHNHPSGKQEVVPTLDVLSAEFGKVGAVVLDNGYFSEANIQACEERGIEPCIATGREPHHLDWHTYFSEHRRSLPRMRVQKSG